MHHHIGGIHAGHDLLVGDKPYDASEAVPDNGALY
jgi:hypothetical protein